MLSKLKSLGPGLLYAGAAIGVSHLVQSTKAGAKYGYVLILALVIAHLVKYPFFAAGPRYSHQAGENLVAGFQRIGKWAIATIAILTFVTMFTIQAAVTVVTAGLAQQLTGIVLEPWLWSAILLVICILILYSGNFSVLENVMKVVMIVLAVSTILAFCFSFNVTTAQHHEFLSQFSLANTDDLGFLVAFVGWMPAPLDIAIWHSIWTISSYKTNGKKSLRAENFDFKVGFFGTAFLAICFVALGANILYGTGIPIEQSAGKFASQIISLFTSSLGPWAYPIIIVAAFTTMFSTTLTCFQAMPSVMAVIAKENKISPWLSNRVFWNIILAVGTIVLLAFFISSMAQMVQFATTISFVTTPIIALIIYRVVTKSDYNVSIWSVYERRLALLGLVFLSLFCVLFLFTLIN